MNRKGFTLIELLGVIVIIGLVVGLSSFGIIKVYNNSKNKSLALTNKSILEAAEIYANEKMNDEDYWKKGDSYNYFCVTVKELINRGLLKKDKVEKIDNNMLSNYAVVMKNKVSLAIDESKIISFDINKIDESDKETLKACNGSYANENITKIPELKNASYYTDTLEIEFEDAVAESGIVERYCYFGESGSIANNEGVIEGNKCIIGKLKQNTPYYVRIVMKTGKDSILPSAEKDYTTKELKKPTITVNNNVEINFDDEGIKELPGHYFMSELDGNTTSDVLKCTLDNNIFTCGEESTKVIEKNVWYKTNDNKVNISYNNSGQGKVSARITDKSNNQEKNDKEVIIYKVTFVKGLADTIDGQANDKSYYCVAEKNASCKMKSPNFTRTEYKIIGWNENANAHDSSWNVNTEKQINKDSTYYPISSKVITINFKGNADGVADQTKTCTKYNNDTKCSITSPNASRSGYEFLGWGISSKAITSSWNSNVAKDVSSNGVYYAIWKANKPVITSINNSSNGNWTNKNAVIKINVRSEKQLKGIKYSYDGNNWETTDNLSKPVSVSGNNYVFEATWMVDINNTLYFKAVDVNGNESDVKTTAVKIDKTPPRVYISIYDGTGDNKVLKLECLSSNTTECTLTESISTSNVMYINANDNVINGIEGSGVNTSFALEQNEPANNTIYDETKSYSDTGTLFYISYNKNYQSEISNIASGYRVIWISIKDNVGNTTSMKVKIPVAVCGISNPLGCETMYFCRNGHTKVHEAAYSPSNSTNPNQYVTEKGITHINNYWTARFHSPVHVIKETVVNNNGSSFYLVCFDNENYSSSITADSSLYRGAFAQGADGYFFDNGIIPFGGISTPKQCGYVYHKCLSPDINAECSAAECRG